MAANAFGYVSYRAEDIEYTGEPETAEEALAGPHAADWKLAMDEEIRAMEANGTWTLEELPKGRKALKIKWVFKRKLAEDGSVLRYKARLVAKGCFQKYGQDYIETFSPVVRYTSIRFLIALTVKWNMEIDQMDAVTAFLQGDLKEEIFIEQPASYNDGSNRVCRLKKAMYGLKQSGRQWNIALDNVLRSYGLEKSKMDPCVYHTKDASLIVAIYVDDFLIFCGTKKC